MPKSSIKYDYNDAVRLHELSSRIDKAQIEKYGRTLSDPEFIKEMLKKFDASKVPSVAVLSRFRNSKKNAEIPNPTSVNLTSIACTLDVSIDYLLGIGDRDYAFKQEDSRKYGLSEKALKKLAKIKSEADSYDPKMNYSTSLYYRNPYSKRLEILNWMLEQEEVSENETDQVDTFLITLYHLIMNRYEETCGSSMEAVLNAAKIDSRKEYGRYSMAVGERNASYETAPSVTEPDVDTVIERAEIDLIKARKEYVSRERFAIDRRRIMDLYINNGIVPVSDPLTYEEIWLKFPNPEIVFKHNLEEMISKWRELYQEKYEQNEEDQDHAHSRLLDRAIENGEFERIDKLTWEDDNDILEEDIRYRDEQTWDLNEEEMKLYLLCEFLENTPIKNPKFDTDWRISFSNKDRISLKDMDKILEDAQNQRVGLIEEDGQLYFNSELASPTWERLKVKFERYMLPYYYQKWIEEGMPKYCVIERLRYYQYDLFSDEEAASIIETAESAGAHYDISYHHIKIYTDEYEGAAV